MWFKKMLKGKVCDKVMKSCFSVDDYLWWQLYLGLGLIQLVNKIYGKCD
jgi:hypothetical protein